MNTAEIIHILEKNPVPKNYFDGVYPVDYLKYILEKPKLIICNTDSSDGGGVHWIAIFFYKDNQVDFFDSLGRKPCYYDTKFLNFMRKFADECNYTSRRIQPANSDLCGHYCIYFSHKRCQGLNFKNILQNIPNPHFIKLFSEIYLKDYDKENIEKCQKCIKN